MTTHEHIYRVVLTGTSPNTPISEAPGTARRSAPGVASSSRCKNAASGG